MIIEADNHILVSQILKLARKVNGTPLSALEKMLLDGLQNKDAKILVEKHGEDIRGYLFASIEKLAGEDCIFIQHCYIDPYFPDIGHELLNRVRSWGRERNLEHIYMMTERSERGYSRKYGFQYYMTVLKKEVKDGERYFKRKGFVI